MVHTAGAFFPDTVYIHCEVHSVYTPCLEKRRHFIFSPGTLRNANRFSKFFYHHTLQ